MNELIGNSAYLGVLISLASYALGMWLRRKTGLSFLNPLLISIVLVIIFHKYHLYIILKLLVFSDSNIN